jgi:cytochrome oxidase assembly protein ShyY1
MRRLAFLFRPGWIALALVVVGFTYLSLTVLAPWQLGKNTMTSRENNQIGASLSADPVPVTSLLPQQDSAAPDFQWRQVTATGRYLRTTQVLARLRLLGGAPAFEVLTAFAVDAGPTVLVNRGYVRPVDGNKVPGIAAPPEGSVSITARLRDSETAPVGDKQPFREGDFMQVYAIDTRQIADVVDTPLTGSYLQLVENQPGGLDVLPLPQLDAGPFLSYGIQWIAFGILAPIGLGYFAYSEIRMRRREAANRTAAQESAEPVTVEDKLADRYGRRR